MNPKGLIKKKQETRYSGSSPEEQEIPYVSHFTRAETGDYYSQVAGGVPGGNKPS